MDLLTVMEQQVPMGPQVLRGRIRNAALPISNIIAVEGPMAALAKMGVLEVMVVMGKKVHLSYLTWVW